MRLYMIVKYLFLYAVAKLRYGLGQISRKQYHTVRSMSKYYLHVNYTALENYSYYALNQQERWKNDFIQLTEAPYQRQERDTRVIAFYLPQYYEFKLNNDWYGKGFTEWTNCTKAMPQFPGHYQPHLPYDVGYYSLNNSDVMHRQAELARHSGVYGWCYYYYWFHGKRMMEKPIFNFLKDKTIDMPFCLAWTNDNWMKNWSSSRDDDVVREMYYDASIVNDDADHFLPDIIDFFNDHRYIRIDGKPLLIIFRYGYKNFKNFMYELRESYRKKCSTEIYTMLIRNHVDADVDPASLYADAMLEFPPYRCNIKKISNKINMNPGIEYDMYNIRAYIEQRKYIYNFSYPLFKSCFPNWDNTSRRLYYDSASIYQMTPRMYYQWLSDIISYTRQNQPPDKQYVFVNGWNEWAEGAHLEPDMRFGYANLEMTRKAIEDNR